jgi:hypothetical protein
VRPKLARVAVEVALFPARKMEGAGDVTTRVKSAEIPMLMVVDFTNVPLLEVTVNVYVPAGVDEFVDIVRVAIASEPGTKLTVEGAMVVARPEAVGEGDTEMMMLPVNPRLSRVTVELDEPPTMKFDGTGEDTVALKSPVTVIVSVTECAMSPLVPMRVIL